MFDYCQCYFVHKLYVYNKEKYSSINNCCLKNKLDTHGDAIHSAVFVCPNTGHQNNRTKQMNTQQISDDCFYIALFSDLEQTHCAHM